MRVRTLLRSILLGTSALALSAAMLRVTPTEAQTAATGAVLGTVTDPGGAVTPGVHVEVINSATNESRSTETNASGQYVFPNVNPGTYNLKFTKSGFAAGTISKLLSYIFWSNACSSAPTTSSRV